MAITDRKEIERLVRKEIGRLTKKDAAGIDADLHLIEGLGLDSLYMLEMYAMIETTFGVMIPTERLQSMYSINRIIDTIIEEQTKE